MPAKGLRVRKALTVLLILVPVLVSCSSGTPPESLFRDNIEKMVLVDRAMDFDEKVTKITVVKMTVFEDQVEVEVRVDGWATHRDLAIGATLPVSKTRESGWAAWKFFCRKVDKTWVIVEKYKVDEGFNEQ
jgi:hypothetical protein